MSLPPLVSSSPPPPDHCDDDVEDDDIFHFKDPSTSPGHSADNFASDVFENFSYAYTEPYSTNAESSHEAEQPQSTCEDRTDETAFKNEFPADKYEADVEKPVQTPPEENNIEDLNLKLETLHIESEDEKQTTEEDLNSTFDDFGTFLSSQILTDAPKDEFYLPKSDNPTSSDSSAEKSAIDKNDNSDSLKFSSDDECQSQTPPLNLDNTPSPIVDEQSLEREDSFNSLQNEDETHFTDFNERNEETNVDETLEDNLFDHIDAVKCDINENIQGKISFDDAIVQDQTDDDFDDFAAFETNRTTETSEPPTISSQIEFETHFDAFEATSDDKTDDFGDFDSYAPVTSDADDYISKNIAGNDSDIIEKLCSTVGNIFVENDASDISEQTDEIDLKTALGESWTHLVDYDAQQSYLFPWNNSSSQKTLLKCLGIDMRNILFGPKWNTNVPRFAANLGSNPLQPIKQTHLTSDTPPERPKISENPIPNSGESDNDWEGDVEYCSTDFQTSSYAESLLLDLEHLMATLDQMTSGQTVHFKISDLFNNACNEREDRDKSTDGDSEKVPHPSLLNIGRKINLPDTHIFTPTDSETPWSHTIHYNGENSNSNAPKIDLQSSHVETTTGDDFDDFQAFGNFNEPPPPIDRIETLPDKSEHDDFGDFQSVGFKSTPPQILDYSVLEPVKLAPAVPIVNWPAPGEITATIFDTITDVQKSDPDDKTLEFMNVAMPSFILKESKITTSNFDNLTELSQPASLVNDSKLDFNYTSKTDVTTESFAAADDFSDFQSADFTVPSNSRDFFSESKPQFKPLEPIQFAPPPKTTSQQILQPLSLENHSQINWPDPGILQDLSQFNPVNSIKSYSETKDSPRKSNKIAEDDGWSDFVSIKLPNQPTTFNGFEAGKPATEASFEDDDWSDFVSNSLPSKSVGEVKTISQNVATTSNRSNFPNSALPNLSYVSTKANLNRNYGSQFQNL